MKILRSLQISGLIGLATLSPLAMSDTILGLYLGAGVWQADLEGSATQTDAATASLDINDTFSSVDDNSNFFYVALEHPVPVLPNIMLQQTDVSVTESGLLRVDVTFDDQVFGANTGVDSTVDFSHLDATLYYEILDNWVTADLGLTFRQFDGELTLVGTSGASAGETATQELDGVLPMLYAKARIDLPLTGFYISATGNFIGYDGHSITDISGAVGYQSDGWVMDIGLELGLRTFTFELDDLDELDADIDLSGAYAALTIHF